MTNKELRRALLDKLGVSPQALSQRVKRLKKVHPMTTEEATYVIAHQEEIPIDRYLDKDSVASIRQLTLQLTGNPVSQKQNTTRPVSPVTGISAGKAPKELRISDPILPVGKLRDAEQMAQIYPLLYVLENSIRELIWRVMTSNFGPKWWDAKAPRGLRENVFKRQKDNEINSWHQKRGARPIDYLNLDQLPAIVRNATDSFVPTFFPSREWFDNLVAEVYQSRCVVCHMNPLSKENAQMVELRFKQWQKQIDAKIGLLS